MAKIKLNDRQFTITSDYSIEEISDLAERNPDLLMYQMYEDDPLFLVSVAHPGEEQIVRDDIIRFAETSLSDGKATATVTVPGETLAEVKENAYEQYGVAVSRLQEVERAMKTAMDQIVEEKAKFFAALDGNGVVEPVTQGGTIGNLEAVDGTI